MRTGAENALTDVPGLAVGHAAVEGGLSGTTVVLAPPEGAVAGVDVRGAAPGTRETDLLDPRNTVQRVHAVVLSGGSAFGLAAADGVMRWLEERGRGFPVPGGRGPDRARRRALRPGPRRRRGRSAPTPRPASPPATPPARDPSRRGSSEPAPAPSPGASRAASGRPARCWRAEPWWPPWSRSTPPAPRSTRPPGRCWGPGSGTRASSRTRRSPRPGWTRCAPRAPPPSPRLATATTLAVVATDLALDKAGCARLAAMGHDGLARSLSPVHTALDGDVVFGLSTAARPAPELAELVALQAAAADVVARAVVHALLAATTVTTTAGTFRSYRETAALA